jgi:DNA-binding beta-propeller fold protein YncE
VEESTDMMTERQTRGGGNQSRQTLTESSRRSSVASLGSRAKAGHPYIYIVGAAGTAVIDPTNWQLIVVAAGVAPGVNGLLMDNHYRDQLGRLWSQSGATEDGSAQAGVYVSDPKSFRNEKTIPLGHNAVHTVGLTPDGRFAVVPISTQNQLNVYDTNSFEQVATVKVGDGPWDMMVSADGKYCCEPDVSSDLLTIVDPKMWKVAARIPIGEGSGPFMVTIWPNNKFASVECCGYHGGKFNLATGPPAVPTGNGFAIKYVDLTRRSVIKSLPLDFLAVWDEFTPNGKYDFIFGPLAAKTVVVDAGTMEVTETIELESSLTADGYITPDPSGKYVYASVKTGLQVIDISSLQVVETIPTAGVVGTPYVLK